MLQILRLPALNEAQFLGCASAFADSLLTAMQATLDNLRRLEGRPKGAAFAFEMQMDRDRYGALIVLERWADCVNAFAPNLKLSRDREIIDEAPSRVLTGENLLGRANRLIDASPQYTGEVIAAASMAYDAVKLTFRQEIDLNTRMQSLGPMQPEEYLRTRQMFLQDLAKR
ncbi:MAG: hypothetical protein JJE04_00025 [Acidobacteriia bacterium]|nr:hypothetical protein [Terriglobia bacterium]